MTNMCIAICDDQPDVLDTLCKIIRSISDLNDYNWAITPYIHVKDLINNAAAFSIVFLDLSMPEMDGIEAARTINKNNPDCSIIIATGECHRYKEAFQVKALRFITKPFDEDEISEALSAAIKEKPGYETISVYKERVLYSIRQLDILYVRSINSYVEITAIDGKTYRKQISLNDIESILDSRLFVRTHRSYIANMKWITTLNPKVVKLKDKTVPVSSRLYSSVLKKHASFELEFML